MYDIKIGRYDADPQAQGVVRPEDDSWQLVIDKDGFPHLYVRCQFDEADLGPDDEKTGLMCIEDLLPDDITIPDLMKSKFGGKLSPEETQKAFDDYMARKDRTGIPCPR